MKKPKRPHVLPGARIIPRLHMQEGDRTPPFLDNDGEELQLEHPIPPSAPNHRGSVRKQVIPEDIADTLSEIALRAYTTARPTRHGKDADEPFAVSIAPVRALAAAENFVWREPIKCRWSSSGGI